MTDFSICSIFIANGYLQSPIYTNNTNDPMFQQLVKEAELQKFKASEKENPVIANLKNSKYIFDGYALKKIASKEKKLTIVLSERNK